MSLFIAHFTVCGRKRLEKWSWMNREGRNEAGKSSVSRRSMPSYIPTYSRLRQLESLIALGIHQGRTFMPASVVNTAGKKLRRRNSPEDLYFTHKKCHNMRLTGLPSSDGSVSGPNWIASSSRYKLIFPTQWSIPQQTVLTKTWKTRSRKNNPPKKPDVAKFPLHKYRGTWVLQAVHTVLRPRPAATVGRLLQQIVPMLFK